MFSVSLKCRMGVIRRRIKGTEYVCAYQSVILLLTVIPVCLSAVSFSLFMCCVCVFQMLVDICWISMLYYASCEYTQQNMNYVAVWRGGVSKFLLLNLQHGNICVPSKYLFTLSLYFVLQLHYNENREFFSFPICSSSFFFISLFHFFHSVQLCYNDDFFSQESNKKYVGFVE